MTIKEFANEVTAEFEESKMVPAPLVEDNLLLILDNFDSLNEYIEQDVLSALLHRMDKLTGDYKEIVDLFFENQRRNLAEIEPVQETVTSENGKLHTVQAPNVKMTTIDNVEEKEPDWLITNYIPRYQITSLAGDGGSGKTTVWCSLAAAISSGSSSFLTEEMVPEDFGAAKPEKVMFFSAEDSAEYTLRRRLRKNGANLQNILSIDIAEDRFKLVKFNSPFLEALLKEYRPALCIFDPIQAFVPPEIHMGDRNAMRNCLAPLIGYGEKYGTTFLIVEHANKQSGVWGRKRIADSADIWDISRSVIMAGETNEKGIRYLSHEKSNYGPTASSILYAIDEEVIRYKGRTDRKDKDFVTAVDYSTRQAPQREEAENFILEFLQDGEKEISELDDMAAAMSIGKGTLKRAKTQLRQDGKIKTWSVGFNPKRFMISLTDSSKMVEYDKN